MSPQKPIKRKRRGKKGDNCGQCGGTDSSNKEGVLEQMVHCDECGLAGMSCHFDQSHVSELTSAKIVHNTAFFSLLQFIPVATTSRESVRISSRTLGSASSARIAKCVRKRALR